jgi:tRNA U34 5-methylaminomethyl-2-thiouridine-forming methyltransferase MnmC
MGTHHTKICLCQDGSHTLYSEKFHQHYHNPNGAISESRCVFFDTPGFREKLGNSDSYYIFEVGFGTGLNLLLLMEYLCKMDTSVNVFYQSVEAYPLKLDQAIKLNYPEKLELTNAAEILACIFRDLKPGNNTFKIKNNVHFSLFIGSFDELPEPEEKSDMIFFDPFSPDVNPELWTDKVFHKLASWSKPDALLCTYGASSAGRGAMASAGWKVARAPGALGKREMTLASLDPGQLLKWKRVNEERLSERYRNGDFNPKPSL